MGVIAYHKPFFISDPPPSLDVKIQLEYTPFPLYDQGVSIPVSVSSAKIIAGENEDLLQAKVCALLDTGATNSAIDKRLATDLQLKPVGKHEVRTANGTLIVPSYIVDLIFLDSPLSTVEHLLISECMLGYDPNAPHDAPHNFAMLLGRNVMARWNIVWNGPSSTVIISD
ncbi:hypothetical protein R80B4_02705 [Fibrobacteres bacterium R8-0-B4]